MNFVHQNLYSKGRTVRVKNQKVYSVACPHCGATVGSPCRSPSDRWTVPHRERKEELK